ncbi:MAG TPA: ABC transporter substrate-binding protein [Gammaproteobacteria bacterium]
MKEPRYNRLFISAGTLFSQYMNPALFAAVILIVLFSAVSARAEKAFSVGFLNPTIESSSPFYMLVENILNAAANDLGIELHITYGKNNYRRMRQAGLELLETKKPDYFLTGYYSGATDYHMDYIKYNPAKLFMVTSSPTTDSEKEIGKPREKYMNFIGQLTPHDREFGYKQADVLIKQARDLGLVDKDKLVNIIAFGGFDEDNASNERLSGLQDRIEHGKDAVLIKTMLAGWNRNLSYKYTLELLRENPSIHAIWSTNDDMAIGCIDAAEEAGRKPGKDILIGGIDLSADAIGYIESGRQAVSVGGQFMEAAWSLIMLYDYHHGIDFGEAGNYIFHSEAHAVTKQNVADFKKYFLPADWSEIDFRRFTKKHNPDIEEYNFSLEAFQRILANRND